MFHGSGWWSYLGASSEKPHVTRNLIVRVLGYARPYRISISLMLVMILVSTGLSLLTPLILRTLLDVTIPSGDLRQLIMLAIALLLVPLTTGLVGVFQRRLNASVGEGVIYDLSRCAIRTSPEDVFALFHQYQNWRINEPPEQ